MVMNTKGRFAIAAIVLMATSGCDLGRKPSGAPQGLAAYDAIPVEAVGIKAGSIQPGDRLSIRVMGEPELSSDQYWVDGSGMVQMPLAGQLTAGGATTEEIRNEIVARLASRYVRDPKVAVSITEHSKASVTVEGEVQRAGRFEGSPGLTLLGALALAGSTTKDAKLDEVVVFRKLNGNNLAARFNANEVRAGRAADPQIISGDVVVVGRSGPKSAWHDLLQAAPLFNLFYYLK